MDTYTPIFTHVHTHTHKHVLKHTRTYTCTCTSTYTCTHTHVHTHTHTNVYTYTHTYTCTYTYTHKHTHIHTHKDTHTRTHTHPHTQAVPVRVHSTSTKSDFTHSLRFWMISGPDFSGFSALYFLKAESASMLSGTGIHSVRSYMNTPGAQSKSFQKVETQNSIETAPHEAQHVAHHLNVLTEIHSIRISRAHSMSVVQWSGRGKLVSAIEQ